MNTSQTRSNQGNQHTKTTAIASKFILQKTEVTHHSIPSINTPIKPSSNPSSPPPWGAHLGRANAPGGSPGPRTLRRSSMTRWNNFTWLTWSEKGGNIILSKNANPSRSRRKNLSRNEKSSDTTNKKRLCRRLADTRDLKSFSEDRVWGCPRWRHWKSQNCSLIRMIVGLSFCSAFWKLWRGERNHSCIDDAVWTRLQEPFHAGP